MAPSSEGSSIKTFWNLLSSAESVSIYFLYSLVVVAPMVRISPLASIGFRIFDVSMAPLVPLPIMLWSSSINRIICPSENLTISKTFFNLSSKSPLNFAPARTDVISRENTTLSLKVSGTSPDAILKTSPSTTAVLPTPASPIKTGLFFILLERTLMTFEVSSSLPMIGSIFPSFASSVRFLPNFRRYFKFSDEMFPSFFFVNSSRNLDFITS